MFLLFMTLAHAADPRFCAQDLSGVPLSLREGPLMPQAHLMDRALRPGLTRFQQDVCRCLPKRRHRPAVVEAQLHVNPNRGETTVKYRLARPWSPAMSRMVACLGEPTVTFEPFRYVSDMITEDGRKEVFRYPLKVEFEGVRARKVRSLHKQ